MFKLHRSILVFWYSASKKPTFFGGSSINFVISSNHEKWKMNFDNTNCSERNHVCGSSKCTWICLVCKMRSGGEKQWLGRLNSHPPDCESYLMSGLPMCWRACKLPHCLIDPDVAFWFDYLSPAWMHQGERRFECWWCITRDKLGCRTAKEDCCRQKGIHRKKLWELSFSA